MRIVKIILLFLPISIWGQNNFTTDSLKVALRGVKSDSEKINLLLRVSDAYTDTDINKSIAYADSALAIAELLDENKSVSRVLKFKGDKFSKLGIIDASLDNYLQAKRILQKLNDTVELVSLNHNIGAVYYYQDDYQMALKYFKDALQSCIELQEKGDTTFSKKLHIIYNTIGSSYDLLDKDELALTYFVKAEENALRYDDYYSLGNIYNNLGKLFSYKAEHDTAFYYLNLSLENRQKINDVTGMARSYLFMASHYMNNDEYNKAMVNLLQVKELCGETRDIRTKRDLWGTLYQLYRYQNNSDSALAAYERFNQYEDSIINEASLKEMTRLQMKYEYDTKEQQRLVEQQRTRLIFITSIAILSLLSIIIGLLYGLSKSRGKRILLEKERLERDLELKNKELTTNVMYLLKKNEFLSVISTRLLEVKDKMRGDNKQTLQQVIYDVQSAVDEDVWEEFELRFQKVHDEFFEKLKAISSELTPTEMKICAFLRLSLKTKEIAAITHLSIRTIEVTRSNIRKKLRLTHSDTNLISFLNNL